MKQYVNLLGIQQSNVLLYKMGRKEKEHEVYFLDKIKVSKVLLLS